MDDHLNPQGQPIEEDTTCHECPDEIIDPHLPERPLAVTAARHIYGDPNPPGHVDLMWVGKLTVEKYRGKHTDGDGKAPYEIVESGPNLLVNAGINILEDAIIGVAFTAFNNANARICVGDSTTAAAASQTDLQASTNKLRKAMDATFPSRASQTVTFKSTFATTDANFAWNEWAVANSASGATILNRSVQSFGTKTSADTWVATVTMTMSGT